VVPHRPAPRDFRVVRGTERGKRSRGLVSSTTGIADKEIGEVVSTSQAGRQWSWCRRRGGPYEDGTVLKFDLQGRSRASSDIDLLKSRLPGPVQNGSRTPAKVLAGSGAVLVLRRRGRDR